jgi:hypothetical protein
MNRRTLVQLLPLALAGCAEPSGTSASGSGSSDLLPGQYTDFNVWLNAARAAGTQLLEKRAARDPARFVQFLAVWAVAMPRFVVREWREVKGANNKLELATLATGSPFLVSAFRMAPSCIQPVHAHPGAGGITLCHEGSLAIKHFDLIPGSTEYSNTGGPAEIQEAAIAHLHTGRFTTFTPSAGNLHELEAGPEGAVGVDIHVQWQGTGAISYIKLAQSTATSEGQVGARHPGKWVGTDIAQAYG